MAISLTAARKLCTGRELELVEASRASAMKEMSPAQLRQKVQRSRTLRDKYRDLAKRQRLQARGKSRPSGRRPAQGNENTVRKAQLFDEVLGRFRSRLERASEPTGGTAADGARKRAGTKASKSSKAGAAKKRATAKPDATSKRAKKGGAAKRSGKSGAAAKQMSEPGNAGAPAPKSARRPGRADRSNVGAGRSQHAHTKASNRRSQKRRDRR